MKVSTSHLCLLLMASIGFSCGSKSHKHKNNNDRKPEPKPKNCDPESSCETMTGLKVDYVKFEQLKNGGWSTQWQDDFTSNKLNRNDWNVLVGTDAEFNNEKQWYVDEEGKGNNFWLEDGHLFIQVQKEKRRFDGRDKAFTSARLSTKAR